MVGRKASSLNSNFIIEGVEVEVGYDTKVNKSSKSKQKWRSKYHGHQNPFIPSDLVWYEHEETWKRIAQERLHRGLKEFSIEVFYNDDFGINQSLSAKAEGAGLKLGGTNIEFEKTKWKISGVFL